VRRERKVDLDECLGDIVKAIGSDRTKYTRQLEKDPVALADRLAAVELKNPEGERVRGET